MAAVRKRTIKGKTYFYLEHTFRINEKTEKKEKYLGKEIPKNIDKIKNEFMFQIYKEKWFKKLDKLKKKFSKEYKSMPRLAKEKFLENFMIKFTYNTNRIEGSTLTLRETAHLLEEGIAPKNKLVKYIKEAEAHKEVFYQMLEYKGDLNLNEILRWHKLLFERTEPEIAGKIRKHQVAISGTRVELPFPAELNYLAADFFKWYGKNKNKLHPVELAALVHLKFVSIHPFTDGNGRVSRLMINFVLNKHGFPMLDISYQNRSNYYTALERSQIKKVDYIFVQHIIRRYLKDYQVYWKK